mmetsp:Transcript_32841/g.75008  ORF Transcript_32841/g.75008 Transcript_32841/m.75008 type:complete len:267 (-) Transcript_32841:723-1523(-)
MRSPLTVPPDQSLPPNPLSISESRASTDDRSSPWKLGRKHDLAQDNAAAMVRALSSVPRIHPTIRSFPTLASIGSLERWNPSGVRRNDSPSSTVRTASTSRRCLQAWARLRSGGGVGVMLRNFSGRAPGGGGWFLVPSQPTAMRCSSRLCSKSNKICRISSSNGVLTISGAVWSSIPSMAKSSGQSLQHVPPDVRPARPARCVIDARDVQTVVSSRILVDGLYLDSLTRHVSMTWVMSGMVTEVSAMFVLSTTLTRPSLGGRKARS